MNHGANIINLSLGSRDPDKAEETAVRWACNRGVLVIAAVGNDGSGKSMYPAGCGDNKNNAIENVDPVIGVGAVYRSGDRAAFSQSGNPVDVVAPGVRVFSTFPTRAGFLRRGESGTSMSTPFVAGTAALVLAAHGHQSRDVGTRTCERDNVGVEIRQPSANRPRPPIRQRRS